MKELVLLFHFEKERAAALKKALLPLKIACRTVDEEHWNEPVGKLLGLKTTPVEAESGELTEEVLLLCGMEMDEIQRVLIAMRKAGLYVPYKASLTETNKDWTVSQLFVELYREHQYMMEQQKAKQNNE